MHAFTADGPTGFPPPMTAPRSVPAPTDDVLTARPANDFDALFAAHYERLVRALTLVAGDAEAAADAVQEAFVRAHLRWRTISRYDDPIGWVRRVAINQIRDGHRRRVRKDRALLRLAGREAVATAPVEIDEFDRLLAELPKQQRAATALYYVDGLSVAEIATALGIAEGSVKSHLHDARRRLRPVLEREAAGRDGRPGTRPPPPPPPPPPTDDRSRARR
jgi:RNA polymerase sigma-70 factor (ECF subfamily)